MGVPREMRRLCDELVSGLATPAPAPPHELYRALCEAMSGRRGRPVLCRTAVFPPGTASGLWLDLADRDLIVVEERTAPEHQLVILGHELWHMQAHQRGQDGGHGEGPGGARRLLADADRDGTDRVGPRAAGRRVAAHTRFDHVEERQAETFGLLLASKCRTRLIGSAPRGPVQHDGLVGRIGASLGYRGSQG
ncbi:toxin-antitoxin system, toxin component [Streptomyces sp. NPDC048514]|uniref:toxin-antitoxin system, toxin component n=1 Tax=Streptomyces sp. NPDC048514 TaxID=3365564 RepID=UPI0037227305